MKGYHNMFRSYAAVLVVLCAGCGSTPSDVGQPLTEAQLPPANTADAQKPAQETSDAGPGAQDAGPVVVADAGASDAADAGPTFSASCSGTAAVGSNANDPGASFSWTYDVTDADGTAQAHGSVTMISVQGSCSGDGTFTDANEPLSGPRDEVSFGCNTTNAGVTSHSTKTLALDRSTMTVTITFQADTAYTPFTWVVNCN